MIRKDKLITDRVITDEIIRDSLICHLSCSLDDSPYLIPISFGYDGQAVYLHTAQKGKKITIFEHNPRVCLSFVSQSDLVTDLEQACQWSFDFASVIAEGAISEIREPDEKAYALNQIMIHYSGVEWDFPEKTLAGTRMWKIVLEGLTGKISPAPER
jgi:nitroimidazol reductase NimA-like FMN-containing flavoprotein (pyridoxamine 5'-phosphate oxidase superfamily)